MKLHELIEEARLRKMTDRYRREQQTIADFERAVRARQILELTDEDVHWAVADLRAEGEL